MPEPASVIGASLSSSNPVMAHLSAGRGHGGRGTGGRGAAAIHHVLRTGDVGCEVRAQELHDVGDFLGRAVAAERDGGLVAGADRGWIAGVHLLLDRMDHAGVDRAGTYRVDTHAVFRDLA